MNIPERNGGKIVISVKCLSISLLVECPVKLGRRFSEVNHQHSVSLDQVFTLRSGVERSGAEWSGVSYYLTIIVIVLARSLTFSARIC